MSQQWRERLGTVTLEPCGPVVAGSYQQSGEAGCPRGRSRCYETCRLATAFPRKERVVAN